MIGLAVTVTVSVAVIASGAGQSHLWAFNIATPEASLNTHSEDALSGDNSYRVLYYWRGALMRPSGGLCATHRLCTKGMLITRVAPGSTTAAAGLRPGDVITTLDRMSVDTPRSLAMAVADHPTGPKVELRVWRDWHVVSIAVASAA